jgi:hypothetical protein
MSYYRGDHEFEGQQGEPCEAEVPKSRRSWHSMEPSRVVEFVSAWGGSTAPHPQSICVAMDPDVGQCGLGPDDEVHQSTRKCGASWTSAVHPPDQFRHWCSALEAGGDCMHFED